MIRTKKTKQKTKTEKKYGRGTKKNMSVGIKFK